MDAWPPMLQSILESNVDGVRALLPSARRRYQLELSPNEPPSFLSPLGLSLMVCLASRSSPDSTAFEVFNLVLCSSDPNVVFVLSRGYVLLGTRFKDSPFSPLMLCVVHNAPVEICRLLIERGADANVMLGVSSKVSLLVDPSGSLGKWTGARVEKVSPLFEIICRGRRDLLQLVLDSGALCNFAVTGSSTNGVAISLLSVVRWFERFDLLAEVLMHSSQPRLLLHDNDCDLVFRFMDWNNPATKKYVPMWFKRKLRCLSLCINRICTENSISYLQLKDVKRNVLFRLVFEAEVCMKLATES